MSSPLVVVGDTLLDIDTTGVATRLSPDSPVPVVEDAVEVARPGGAGLAAVMAARDGQEVVLVTAVADCAGCRASPWCACRLVGVRRSSTGSGRARARWSASTAATRRPSSKE